MYIRETGRPIEDPPFKPLNKKECCDGPGGIQGGQQLAPMMLRDARLSDSCTSDQCSFSSLVESRQTLLNPRAERAGLGITEKKNDYLYTFFRETGVSRHNGGQIRGPHEFPRTTKHI